MSGQRIAYVRVSTLGQNAVRQLDGISIDKVFIEKASGKEGRRAQPRGADCDPTAPVGLFLFNLLGMVAEPGADLIRARIREGMAIARAAGLMKGRNPKLYKAQEEHPISLHRAGTAVVPYEGEKRRNQALG